MIAFFFPDVSDLNLQSYACNDLNDPVAFSGYLSNLATQLRHTARVLHDRESLEKRQASSPMVQFLWRRDTSPNDGPWKS